MQLSCTSCHGQESFELPDSTGHERFLPLTGGHADVDCRACHEPEGPRSLEVLGSGIDRPRDRSCVVCHGANGKGTMVPGTDVALAPALVGSPRVQGDARQLVPILLHGLTGPLDGVHYQAGFVAPASAMGIVRDDRLADSRCHGQR